MSGALISVSQTPGLIPLTVIFSPASSSASALLNPSSADLLAEYAVRPGREMWDIMDVMLMMRP